MRLLKMIYAMVLAVIYVTATAMSSLSVFACDHDHLHHTGQAHDHHCHCCQHNDRVDEAFGCDHHHDLLGDTITEYIASGARSTLRSESATHITDYATITTSTIDVAPVTIYITAHSLGYEATLPRAAVITHESLRAPPYWV